MTRDTVRLDDEELEAAIDERAEELGSRSEAYREAVRRAYVEDDATATTDDHTGLPKAAREGYAALREHANTGERLALGAAESIIAQRIQLRKETVRSSVIQKLHGAGWIAVEQGVQQVAVVLRPRTASDGGHAPDDRDDDPFDGGDDADAVDVDAEFDRLESAEIDRGDSVATDGGEDVDRFECPYRGCDWEGNEYDPADTYEEIAAEVDATIHWEAEHGGQVPEDAEFGDEQCPECYAINGLNGTVSCSECGHIPEEVRADGGEVIAVSPTTGVVYAVAEYEENADGRITALDKRPLSRAEIADRLGEVHPAARRAYREHLGGDGQ